MKLRRAIAVAAATAALSPLALLSAPAAFAEDSDSASPSPSGSASPSAPASGSETGSGSGTGTDAGSGTGTETGKPASNAPSDAVTGKPTGAPTGTATGTPTGKPSSTPTGAPTGTASAPADVDYCENIDPDDEDALGGISEALSSGLHGLPSKVVAGSGWKNFTFKISNTGDRTIKNIKPMLGVGAISEDADYSTKVTLQILQKSTGTWKTLADASGDGATLSAITLNGGQSTSYSLRLSVNGSVPASIGLTGGIAMYSDTEGCWVSDDPNLWVYTFDILAAGSHAGKPSDAKPQTGGAKPVNLTDVDATGTLAETGAGSALPMIGLVGGAAVVVGAGAVFLVRRRKTDGSHA